MSNVDGQCFESGGTKELFLSLRENERISFTLCARDILSSAHYLLIVQVGKKGGASGRRCLRRERKRVPEIARNSNRIYQIARSVEMAIGALAEVSKARPLCRYSASFPLFFRFKNKTRGAVDNACRCASVIIKSRRTRGTVTLIPTNGALHSRRRRCRTPDFCLLFSQ